MNTTTMTDTPPPVSSAPKSRLTYILLALFLGGIGIHNFYSGNKKHGIIKIALLFACGLGVLVNPIWSIVEMITVTKDENGVQFS
jgi:TM2 domain-containing membrane protein YozV